VVGAEVARAVFGLRSRAVAWPRSSEVQIGASKLCPLLKFPAGWPASKIVRSIAPDLLANPIAGELGQVREAARELCRNGSGRQPKQASGTFYFGFWGVAPGVRQTVTKAINEFGVGHPGSLPVVSGLTLTKLHNLSGLVLCGLFSGRRKAIFHGAACTSFWRVRRVFSFFVLFYSARCGTVTALNGESGVCNIIYERRRPASWGCSNFLPFCFG
jgi:hypothetical protein